MPDDEYGFADLLLQAGLVDKAEKELLHDLRGLRNRLVHRYGSIDDEIVHARVHDRLDEVQALVSTLRTAADET